MTSKSTDLKMKTACLWLGVAVLFFGIECLVIVSQLQRGSFPTWSTQFFLIPLVLTLPLAIGGGAFLRMRGTIAVLKNAEIYDSFSRLTAVLMIAAYVTAFSCLARFV